MKFNEHFFWNNFVQTIFQFWWFAWHEKDTFEKSKLTTFHSWHDAICSTASHRIKRGPLVCFLFQELKVSSPVWQSIPCECSKYTNQDFTIVRKPPSTWYCIAILERFIHPKWTFSSQSWELSVVIRWLETFWPWHPWKLTKLGPGPMKLQVWSMISWSSFWSNFLGVGLVSFHTLWPYEVTQESHSSYCSIVLAQWLSFIKSKQPDLLWKPLGSGFQNLPCLDRDACENFWGPRPL